MQVVETNLKFNGALRPRKATRWIVIHHSASLDVSAADIHAWHLNRGWAGIGYHYVIRQDGTIERGRPEGIRGAHAWKDEKHEANSDGIGICITGNFENSLPTPQQIDSLVWLIKDIRARYGKSNLPVIGHKDVMPTACPGKNFPWEELRAKLKEKPIQEPQKIPCTIDIRGKKFPGYVYQGDSYFQDADVTDVIKAINAQCEWDGKNMIVKVR